MRGAGAGLTYPPPHAGQAQLGEMPHLRTHTGPRTVALLLASSRVWAFARTVHTPSICNSLMLEWTMGHRSLPRKDSAPWERLRFWPPVAIFLGLPTDRTIPGYPRYGTEGPQQQKLVMVVWSAVSLCRTLAFGTALARLCLLPHRLVMPSRSSQ